MFLTFRITLQLRRSTLVICLTLLDVSPSSVSARRNAQSLNVWPTHLWWEAATTERNSCPSALWNTLSRSFTCWPARIHCKWVLFVVKELEDVRGLTSLSPFVDPGLSYHQLRTTWRFNTYWSCWYRSSSSRRRFTFETCEPSYLVVVHWRSWGCIP